jgi:hypothetical protein
VIGSQKPSEKMREVFDAFDAEREGEPRGNFRTTLW